MTRVPRVVAAVVTLILAAALTACGPGISVPQSDVPGVGTDGYTPAIPADWPSVVPLPQGMNLESATKVNMSPGVTFSASYSGTTDPAEVIATLSSEFEANGFTSDASFGGGADGGVSTWKDGTYVCQLTVVDEGERTVVNITAIQSS